MTKLHYFIIMILFFKLKGIECYGVRFASSRINHMYKLSMVATDKPETISVDKNKRNVVEQIGAAGLASAAVVAAAAVNSAVGMRTLQAPDSDKTFVFKDGASLDRIGKIDEYGLPLVYDKDLIQAYWKKQGSALTQRWTEFLGYSVPFLTKMITLVVAGGPEALKENGASLARDARIIFEKLGPTYIKMGQMMSVRPDVLPTEALNELKLLQDSVKPFDTNTAIKQIESELGGNLYEFFSEISMEPVAAASLAQVYRAKLIETGEFVAIKVQRPHVLEVVSKDLYVLRRAAEVYQGLIDRFAPQQRTSYVALLNEWAVGFYTELDFLNEAANQQRLKDLLIQENVTGMYVPKVYHKYCTRRVLVTEWIDGKKLSECEPSQLNSLIPDAQEAFLTQLLQVGFFHSDPHPGNILFMHEPKEKARMALIDFGLVASLKQSDMDTMVSAIIHLANRDYPNLVDDFISLGILPKDCDRIKVIPLMDKALTPYVKGGGATSYETELKKMYGMDGTMKGTAGGFQQMTQDALTVLNDIPFTIPPYFALLARAIVTLEGVALSGNPKYGIIMESYPFVARKLLRDDRPMVQKALQELLYVNNHDNSENNGLQSNRLSVLLNSALGIVAKSSNAFIDFDSIPEDSIDISTALKFILSKSSKSLRVLLINEAVNAGDILLRQATRKSYQQVLTSLPIIPYSIISLFKSLLPSPDSIKIPFLIPNQLFTINNIDDNHHLDSNNDINDNSEEIYFNSNNNITNNNINNNNDNDINNNNINIIKLTKFVQDMKLVPKMMSLNEFIEISSPKLTREEELYAISLTDLATQTLGKDVGMIVNGNALFDPLTSSKFIIKLASTGQMPIINNLLTKTQINSFINNILSPLLNINIKSLNNNNNTSNNQDDSVDELINSLSSLTIEESELLQQTINIIILKINNKIIKRLQPSIL